MSAARILFAAFFVFFSCLAAGDLLFRRLRIRFAAREHIFLAFLTGASIVSTLMFALASLGIVYTFVIILLGTTLIACWGWFCRPKPTMWRDLTPALPAFWRVLFWIPLLLYGIRYLFAAMLPVSDADGTIYHVGLITLFYDHRGFFPLPWNMYAGLAEGIEMLFWVAYSLGRHSAANMVEFLFLLVLPFGLLSFGERIGMPRAGVVAAILFFLAPVAGKTGTIAYIDVAAAAVVFGTFYLTYLWVREGDDKLLVPVGLLAGFCFACKITASTITLFAVAVVLVAGWRRRDWRMGFKLAGVVAAFAVVTAGPWLIRDAIEYRNPLFPLFNSWFPNPYQYPMVEIEMRRDLAHTNGVTYREIPYQLAAGGKLFGIIGPVFFLSPIALISLRFAAGRWLLGAFLIALAPYFTNTSARFFLPCLPFLSMLLAIGLTEIPGLGPAVAFAVIVFHSWTCWPGVIERYVRGFQWRLDPVDIRSALRIRPEATYLAQHVPDYRAGKMLDRYVPAGDLILSLSMSQIAYHHRQLIGSFESTRARRAYLTVISPNDEMWAKRYRRDMRFPPVAASKLRIHVSNELDNDVRIAELRFFRSGIEIPRVPEWRLTASRNPWEVQSAFDNDPWSWWTSGEAANLKTWIEADFARPTQIDRVTVDQIEDQRWIQLRPEVFIKDSWQPLAYTETDSVSPRDPSLRMQLKERLKSMGIGWILVRDGNTDGDDLRKHSPAWGVQQIAETDGYRLWKLL